MKNKPEHEFKITVEAQNRKHAYESLLISFASRQPDGCKFHLMKGRSNYINDACDKCSSLEAQAVQSISDIANSISKLGMVITNNNKKKSKP